MYVAEKEGIYDGALMKALVRGWRIWCCIWSLVARGGLLSIAQMVERQTVVVFFGYLLVAGSIPAAEKN